MSYHSFADRHIGPRAHDLPHMLKTIGVESIDQLIDETVPSGIRLSKDIDTGDALTESQYLDHIKALSLKNKIFKSYIGTGYYGTIVPGVIQRNIFENPGWYTAYTPYQAEIAQGRMEALLNYQTMVCDLTGMPLANASLLDEATAAAEAMHLFVASRSREQVKNNANKIFISEKCFPQTIAVLKTRSAPIGIEVVVGNHETIEFNESYFAAIIQYPDGNGDIPIYIPFVEKAKKHNMHVGVAADLMSLALLMPPGEWGADVVFGSSQRFGVPLGYGGPHAAFFAAKEAFKRDMPGRIIGMSVDAAGSPALRMALQTREQHIKREKATSNICTAQVLLAVMASMYGVYHGPKGIRAIAEDIHSNANRLKEGLQNLGYTVVNKYFFDTLTVDTSGKTAAVQNIALSSKINLRYNANETVSISVDETTTSSDLKELLNVFERAAGKNLDGFESKNLDNLFITSDSFVMRRQSAFMTHPVFNAHHSEHEMLRYIHRLEMKDLSMNHSMISLGSCTMKLNATTEMIPLSWSHWANMHPFAPADQVKGYAAMIKDLEKLLCKTTGFAAMSLQPNSGAAGEYAGLLVIREYHKQNGQGHRNVALIPASARRLVEIGCSAGVLLTFDKYAYDLDPGGHAVHALRLHPGHHRIDRRARGCARLCPRVVVHGIRLQHEGPGRHRARGALRGRGAPSPSSPLRPR